MKLLSKKKKANTPPGRAAIPSDPTELEVVTRTEVTERQASVHTGMYRAIMHGLGVYHAPGSKPEVICRRASGIARNGVKLKV
jgi:hypothetical protein